MTMTEVVEELPPEAGDSMVQVRVGRDYYPAKNVSRCHVCQSPHREFIEAEVSRGTHYTVIARHIADWKPGIHKVNPSADSMARHMREEHAPLVAVQRRKAMERLYEESGRAIDEATDSMVTGVVVAHEIIQRVHERMVKGELEPGFSAYATAWKVVEDDARRNDRQGITEQMWRDAFLAYMDIFVPEVPPERVEAVSRAIENHPAMKALQAAMQQQVEEAPVQGEVV